MKLRFPAFGLDGYVAIGLSVVAAVALAATIWAIRESGKEAQWKKDEPVIIGLRNDVLACKATVAQQSAALKSQNAAVEKLEADNDRITRQAKDAIQRARDEAMAYQRKAERIARARPGPDMCASARELIVDALSTER